LKTNDCSYPAGIRVAKRDHKEELKTRKKKKKTRREKDKTERLAKKGKDYKFVSILRYLTLLVWDAVKTGYSIVTAA
jgi:hypothetical protein